MCNKSSGCGWCARILLSILNFVLFLCAAGVFTTAAIFKWAVISDNELLQDIYKYQQLHLSEYVSTGLLVILCISAAVMVISFIGFFGSCCGNKCLLITYLSTLTVVFIAHLVGLILFITKKKYITDQAESAVQSAANSIVSSNATNYDKTVLCGAFKTASTLFKCCGANGTSDFEGYSFFDTNTNMTVSVLDSCCSSNSTQGCSSMLTDFLDSASTTFIVYPNIGILILQLMILLMIIYLVYDIRKQEHKKNYIPRYNDYRDSYELYGGWKR